MVNCPEKDMAPFEGKGRAKGPPPTDRHWKNECPKEAKLLMVVHCQLLPTWLR